MLRTAGSYIKEKSSTILWQYDETDVDFGWVDELALMMCESLRRGACCVTTEKVSFD